MAVEYASDALRAAWLHRALLSASIDSCSEMLSLLKANEDILMAAVSPAPSATIAAMVCPWVVSGQNCAVLRTRLAGCELRAVGLAEQADLTDWCGPRVQFCYMDTLCGRRG